MKYLLTVLTLCLLLFSTEVNAQATNFQRNVVVNKTFIMDSTTTDTIVIGLPNNRGKATFAAYLSLDDLLEGAGYTASHDCLLIQYRPMKGPGLADTLVSSAGGGITWKNLQIYNGPAGSLTDFDNAITWVDSVNYMCAFDMDGLPWRHIEMLFTQSVTDCTTKDDCTRVTIDFDVD